MPFWYFRRRYFYCSQENWRKRQSFSSYKCWRSSTWTSSKRSGPNTLDLRRRRRNQLVSYSWWYAYLTSTFISSVCIMYDSRAYQPHAFYCNVILNLFFLLKHCIRNSICRSTWKIQKRWGIECPGNLRGQMRCFICFSPHWVAKPWRILPNINDMIKPPTLNSTELAAQPHRHQDDS